MSRDSDNDEIFIEREYERDRRIWHALHLLNERMITMEASQAQNQAAIDADKAAVQALGPKLDTIRVEVDALKNAQSQGQTLDFTGLDAAVQAVGGQVDADQADAALTAPAPAPAPAATAPADPAPAAQPDPSSAQPAPSDPQTPSP